MTHSSVLQLKGDDEEIPSRRPHPQKSSAQPRSSRPKLGGSIQDHRSINHRCISINSFEWISNPEIVEHRLFKNVLLMIVCTFVNKIQNLKILNLKTHVMNFELGGHIVQNAEPEKKESDLLKKTRASTEATCK